MKGLELDDRIRELRREQRVTGLPKGDLSIDCSKEEIKLMEDKYHFAGLNFGSTLMGVLLVEKK